MNKILFICLVCFSIIGFSQNNIITGSLIGFNNGDKIRLNNRIMMNVIDSAMIENGQFILKNNSDGVPRRLILSVLSGKKWYYSNLFIANENVRITGDKIDFQYNVKVEGSKNQELEVQLNSQLRPLEMERAEIGKFWRTEVLDSNEVYKNKLKESNKRAHEIDDLMNDIRISFVKKNINTYAALNQLGYLYNKFSKDELQEMYNSLESKYKECIYGQEMSNYLKVEAIVNKGDLYADFEAKDQFGKNHKLSEMNGQYILLDFTKEYCAPCVASIVELKQVNKEYGDKLKIVSFCIEKNELIWKNGIEKHQSNWLCLWDGNAEVGKTVLKYGVESYPTFFLINPKGEIVEKIHGYHNGELEKALKEEFSK